jgi:hypothetical protein
MKICVHSNRGMRGEETPCAFYLGGRRLPVLAVIERWQDTAHHFYEVMVDDGRRFVLRFEPGLRSWELAAVFAAQIRKPAPKPARRAEPRRSFFGFNFRKAPATSKV